jgi:hypothetical protein
MGGGLKSLVSLGFAEFVGGKGDGMIVLILAVVICALVFFKYRLIAGAVGLAVNGLLLNTFVRLVIALNDVGEAAKLPEPHRRTAIIQHPQLRALVVGKGRCKVS